MSEADEQEGHGEAGKKKLSSKKLILFIVLPLLLIIGGGAGLYFSGMLDGLLGKKKHAKDEAGEEAAAEGEHGEKGKEGAAKGPGYYYDMPDLLINLSDDSSRGKGRYLKLSISLEIPKKEDEPKLKAVMPKITDYFQTYLRELRVDDLRGSAGIYRLRQELLARVRVAAEPLEVRDVLFREILVQ